MREPHGLEDNDIVSFNVINTGTTGIGSNSTVVVEFDEITQSLIIDPQVAESTGINTDISTITIPNHGFVRGDYVLYTAPTAMGGLVSHEKYFVVPFDGNRFQLAKTFRDIQIGSESIVVITSVGSAQHTFSKVSTPN